MIGLRLPIQFIESRGSSFRRSEPEPEGRNKAPGRLLFRNVAGPARRLYFDLECLSARVRTHLAFCADHFKPPQQF
jgi:hypothetical protein